MKNRLCWLASAFLISAICIVPVPTVYATHTLEITMTEELAEDYLSRKKEVRNEDGVFYSTQLYGEFEFDPYITSNGCFDRSPLLLALLLQYPKSRFGVQIECTYGTDLHAEITRLDRQGIEAHLDNETHRLVAVLNADQLENFPASSEIGYRMGLAQSPTLSSDSVHPKYGDANGDSSIDIMDVIHINKYLLGNGKITLVQMELADCNRDGIVDEIDSLNILKYIVGIIDHFDT